MQQTQRALDELREHLDSHWGMKPEYAADFLETYKNSLAKMLSEGRSRRRVLQMDAGSREIAAGVNDEEEDLDFALVGQAYFAYMNDLRRGKHVGTRVERVIWLLLSGRGDLVESIDRGLAKFFEDNCDVKFPNLGAEVLVDGEGW